MTTKLINNKTANLCLGTVQFGLNYGVANQKGQVSLEEVKSILKFANQSGIQSLDTAIAYGQSEKVLGEAGVYEWKIISKLPAIPENANLILDWVLLSIDESMMRLKVISLYGVLLHRPEDLLSKNGDTLYKALLMLKAENKVLKIGISIYDPSELDKYTSFFDLDIVQAPMNIFDRRLVTSGWLDKLNKKNIEIHTRSVFLQGLLLMSENDRPIKFNKWNPLWEKWQSWLMTVNLSPLQACLGFMNQFSKIDKIVIGVDSQKHLEEILLALQIDSIQYPDELQSDDNNLINPSNWKNL